MNQIAYLVYGNNADVIDEARFSILSAIYHSTDDDRPKFVVITDTPAAFSNLPVTIETIDKGELTDWYGPDAYNHRSKPNALLKVIDHAEKTVLIDTDTVFKKPPIDLFHLINKNTILVDKIHAPWNKTPEKFYDNCYNFLSSTYGIDNNLRPINSGIIGLTNSNKHVIQDTVKIIDQIYNMSGRLFHVEQFALAVATTANNLQAISHNNLVHHYWSRKSIHRAIAQSFMNAQADLLSEKAKHQFFNLSFSIPKPPWYYRVYLKLHSKKLEDKIQLRQFYVELGKALYPYSNTNEFIQAEMINKALSNLKERNMPLFRRVLANGVESLIGPSLLNVTSVNRINKIAEKHQ